MVPPTTAVVVVGIFDHLGQIVDNNRSKGYFVPLFNKHGQRFRETGIKTAEMIPYVYRHLKLRLNRSDVIGHYEEDYAFDPKLKAHPSYFDYLRLLYIDGKKDATMLKSIAKAMETNSPTDVQLSLIADIYSLIGLKDEEERIHDLILQKFPNGNLAAEFYLQAFKSDKDLSEKEILKRLDHFHDRFSEYFTKSGDTFYSSLLVKKINDRDIESVMKYEEQLNNKNIAFDLYCQDAQSLLEKQDETVDMAGMEFASWLMNQAIQLAAQDTAIASSMSRYCDAIAIYSDLFYRINRMDSALYYLQYIEDHYFLELTEFEKFAHYSQQTRGHYFAKQLIEEQLLDGVFSISLLNQLEDIYAELELSSNALLHFKQRYMAIIQENARAKVQLIFESEKAPDFSLKNLKGEIVTLSAFRDKIVVIDFWATWCKPCIAMFPKMQKMIDAHSSNKNIEFLFVDMLEQSKNEMQMLANATTLMQRLGHKFNILLDVEDELLSSYRIGAIPTKCIIDKNGDIAFIEQGGAFSEFAFVLRSLVTTTK